MIKGKEAELKEVFDQLKQLSQALATSVGYDGKQFDSRAALKEHIQNGLANPEGIKKYKTGQYKAFAETYPTYNLFVKNLKNGFLGGQLTPADLPAEALANLVWAKYLNLNKIVISSINLSDYFTEILTSGQLTAASQIVALSQSLRGSNYNSSFTGLKIKDVKSPLKEATTTVAFTTSSHDVYAYNGVLDFDILEMVMMVSNLAMQTATFQEFFSYKDIFSYKLKETISLMKLDIFLKKLEWLHAQTLPSGNDWTTTTTVDNVTTFDPDDMFAKIAQAILDQRKKLAGFSLEGDTTLGGFDSLLVPDAYQTVFRASYLNGLPNQNSTFQVYTTFEDLLASVGVTVRYVPVAVERFFKTSQATKPSFYLYNKKLMGYYQTEVVIYDQPNPTDRLDELISQGASAVPFHAERDQSSLLMPVLSAGVVEFISPYAVVSGTIASPELLDLKELIVRITVS